MGTNSDYNEGVLNGAFNMQILENLMNSSSTGGLHQTQTNSGAKISVFDRVASDTQNR